MLADHVIDSVAVGNCADVPLLISHTRDEMRLFAANGRGLGPLPTTDDELADRFGHAFTDGAAALAAYRAAEPDASSEEIWLSYLTDTTLPHARLRARRGAAHPQPAGVDGPVLVAGDRVRTGSSAPATRSRSRSCSPAAATSAA